MITLSHTLRRETLGNDHIVDLTDELQALVRESGIRSGQLAAMITGSTGALSTLYFPSWRYPLEADDVELGTYELEETWHDDNGHSHVRACLIGPSLALPIVDGALPLGTWQQVVLLDFDTRARSRRVAITLIGE